MFGRGQVITVHNRLFAGGQGLEAPQADREAAVGMDNVLGDLYSILRNVLAHEVHTTGLKSECSDRGVSARTAGGLRFRAPLDKVVETLSIYPFVR